MGSSNQKLVNSTQSFNQLTTSELFYKKTGHIFSFYLLPIKANKKILKLISNSSVNNIEVNIVSSFFYLLLN